MASSRDYLARLTNPQAVAGATLTIGASETIIRIPHREPHCANENFDWDWLRIVIQSKRAEVEDHIWSLRENPGYYESYVQELARHRVEQVSDEFGRLHVHHNRAPMWNATIKQLVIDSYTTFLFWGFILEDFDLLFRLNEQHSMLVDTQVGISPAYLHAILCFRNLLVEACRYFRSQVKMSVAASPKFREQFVRHTLNTISEREPITGDPLVALFMMLGNEEKPDRNLDGPLGQIQEMSLDLACSKRMSSRLLDLASNLALVNLILSQLDRYQPWAATFSDSINRTTGEIDKDWEIRSIAIEALSVIDFSELARFGDPVAERFHYACNDDSAKATAQMRVAEHNLDSLWNEIDKRYQRYYGTEETLKTKHHGKSVEWSEFRKTGKTLAGQSQGNSNSTTDIIYVDHINAFYVFDTMFSPHKVPKDIRIKGGLFRSAMKVAGFEHKQLFCNLWIFTRKDQPAIQIYQPPPGNAMSIGIAKIIGTRLSRIYGFKRETFKLRGQGIDRNWRKVDETLYEA